MPYRAPGLDDDRLSWILIEVRQAQATLDARIADAQALPDTEPSKAKRIVRLNQMKREVDSAFIQLDSQIRTWADRDIRSFYRQGHNVASAQLSAGFDFTLPHREALDLISFDAYDDVATRLLQVRSGFDSTIELQKMFEKLDASQISTIQGRGRSAVTQALLTGEDPRKIAKLFAQDLWKDGIQIVDSGGRQWNPESYTRMLIRTKTANAYNSGSMNKYAEEGVSRVKVFDGVEDDEECAEANGQIWSLRYAMNNVIEHPNCRRAFAPEQGEGPVNKDTTANVLVKFDRLELGIGALLALRTFRSTGELNVTSTLARLVIEGGELLLGTSLPVMDVFLQGLVSGSFRNLDFWIESYIDPVLYAAGIVRNVPPRAALQAALRPDNVIDEITQSIKAANKEAFGVEFHPGVRAVLDRLDNAASRSVEALRVLGVGVGGEKHLDWVVEHALDVDRLGRITAEVFQQVRAGNIDDLKTAWVNTAAFVDEARKIQRLYVQSAIVTRNEAEEIYNQLDEILTELTSLLHHNVDIENLPAALEFMTNYSQINDVDLKRLLEFWSNPARKLDLDSYEVRKISEMFEAALTARNRILGRIEEIDGSLRRRGQRQLLMAAPSGPDFPSEATTLWDLVTFDGVVTEMEERLRKVLPKTSSLDEKLLISWQEFFRMLTFDDNRSLRDEFLKFNFIEPRLTENLKGFVDADDLDTPLKVFEFWVATLLELTVDSTTQGLRSFGDEVDDHLLSQITEVLGWFDHERYFKFNLHAPLIQANWEPQVLGKHIAAVPAGEEGALLSNLWKGTVKTLGSINTQAIANPYHNLRAVLSRAYDSQSVDVLGATGINGVLYWVRDPDTGLQLIVKRITSAHAGETPSLLTSNVMSEFFASRLAGVEGVPTRFISLTDESEEVLIVMPFVDGLRWHDATPALVRDDSLRKFSLLDRLTLERDSHAQNYLINEFTETSTAIDREMSFALWKGADFTQDWSDLGMQGAASKRLLTRLSDAWSEGDDLRLLMNDPEVSLFKLTAAEVESISGHSPSDIGTLRAIGGRDSDRAFFLSNGIIFNTNNEAFVPTGRIGLMDFPGVFPEWHPSHFLTESEFRFVDDLMGASVDDDLYKAVRETLDDAYSNLSPETKNTFIRFWTAQDFDDALDEATAAVIEQTADRARRLLDGGTVNISGGLSRYIDPDTGQELRYGTVVEFVDKTTGERIEGLVVNLYETGFISGEVSVVVLRNAGVGKSASELTLGTVTPQRINLVEWRWGPLVEETPKGKVKLYREALEEFDDPTGVSTVSDFHTRHVPMLDDNGLHVGFREETMDLDMASVLGGGVIVRNAQGQTQSIPTADFLFHRRFLDMVEEEVGKLHPQFRPKTIKPTMDRLVTNDGKAAFGLFDPDTGELHISLAPLFDSSNISKVPGNSSSFYLDVEGSLNTLKNADWVDDLNWEPIVENFRHELGHAVQVGQERQVLSQLSFRIFNQLQGQNSAVKTLADLEVFAGTLIPARFDTSQYANNIAALIAHRAGLVEDVVNTNLVFDAKAILESGLATEELPAWARAAYAGILREEPEAHHELFAEIWKRVIAAGGETRGVEKVADDLGVDSDLLLRVMTRDFEIELPREWDMGQAEFNRWLTDVLSPAADRIIPLERNLNRRLWSAQRYSVADIRVRVLHTAPEKGGGGITINLVTGEEPKKGFSVAKKSNERIFEGVTDDSFDEIVENYAEEFKLELAKPEWELGLWVDSDGILYVDTVKVFDDELDAAVFGFREGQRAMYRLDGGIEIKLTDEFESIEDFIAGYLVRNKLDEVPYGDLLSRTQKIGGVARTIGTGADKVVEEFFEVGGKFRVMSLDWMKEVDKKKILDSLADRYTVSITPAQGKANLIEVMERGLDLFESRPDLREEMATFYLRWRDAFIDASALTKGRRVEIPVHRIAAAASAMSPSLLGEVNLVTVLNMTDVLSRDLVMTPQLVRQTQRGVLRSAVAARKRAAKAADGPAKVLSDLAAAKELEAYAETFQVGLRINAMDPRSRMRAVAGVMILEGRTPIHVSRQWAFYERSVAVLLGEIEPHQALTDTKVRPFFNNIIDPENIRNLRELTVDFVMTDGFFNVKGFRNVNSTIPTVGAGIQAGLRPVISDTIRLLMDEGWGDRFGVTTDLELQAILWGLIRYGKRNGWWPDLETIELKPS